MKRLLHHEKARAFLFGQLEHGDAGRLGEDLGNDAFVNSSVFALLALAPFLFEAKALTEQLLFFVARLRRALEVLVLDGLFFRRADRSDFVVEFAQFRWRRQD